MSPERFGSRPAQLETLPERLGSHAAQFRTRPAQHRGLVEGVRPVNAARQPGRGGRRLGYGRRRGAAASRRCLKAVRLTINCPRRVNLWLIISIIKVRFINLFF